MIQKKEIEPRFFTPPLVSGAALALHHNIADGTKSEIPVVFWTFFSIVILLTVSYAISAALKSRKNTGHTVTTALRDFIATCAIYGIAFTQSSVSVGAIIFCCVVWTFFVYRELPMRTDSPTGSSHLRG